MAHFSRLGDVEVNAGQNASFQCVATGKVSETEPFLLEVRTRRLCPSAAEAGRGARNAVVMEFSHFRDAATSRKENLRDEPNLSSRSFFYLSAYPL